MSALQPPPDIERGLVEAGESASKYNWTVAAEKYRQVLNNLNRAEDPGRAAQVAGLVAESYFSAAFQSTTRYEFKTIMALSESAQQDASTFHQLAKAEALAKRATARALFARFWQSDEPDEKRRVIGESISLVQEAARILEVQGNRQNLPETLLDLLAYREEAVHLSKQRKQLVDLFESSVETAWRIIDDESSANILLMLRSLSILIRLYMAADYVLERPRYEELERKLDKVKDRVSLLAEKIGTPAAKAIAGDALQLLIADLEGDVAKTQALFEQGLANARETRDSLVLGRLYTVAATMSRWAGLSEEYVEKRQELLEKSVKLAQSAIASLEPSAPGPWLKRAYGVMIDASNYLALIVETDIDRKRSILREAIGNAKSVMNYEHHSFLTGMGHQLSRAMYLLATMDVGREEKARLLNEALPIREDTVQTLELLSPHSFSRGTMLNYLALIKSELSKIEEDQKRKLELLTAAASDMQQCMKLCATLAGIAPPLPGQIRAQAQYSEWQGDILQELYNATLDASTAHLTISSYEQTISLLTKASLQASVPPVRWKIARTHDLLREYAEASEAFNLAAEEYRLAAKKLPSLSLVFEELGAYMHAWAVIEVARRNHDQEAYMQAADVYTSVAGLFKASKSWSHLSKHYSACSFLELGEAFGRQERLHAAIESFKSAQATFQDARNELEARLRGASSSQEKKELNDWLDITQGRLRYSLGRAQLEDAKVLDARGEEEASSAQYRTASGTFGSLLSESHHEGTRRDLEALTLLCDAWAKMKAAEASASPELYAQAAAGFARVEKVALGKGARLAALANASMCKALELGSVFRRTRDKQLYPEIKTKLETAADFYEEAGIKKAADWTRATERFFDALTFLGEAEAETDPRKKTEFFRLAENHLSLAAQLYGEAGYFKKKEEALNHLKRAKGAKELLLTPVDVLERSPAVTGTSVTPVSLTRDKATGLERFETANVVGNATLDQNVAGVESDFVLELEVANIGKTGATLLKIENVAQEGLELVRDRIVERMDNGFIDMRGRRLEYLKTHEVKVPIRAKRRGTYDLRPRVLYVDEKGVYRSHQFEAARIIVTDIAGRSLLESERRLSAIMFTDIVGYTSLTEENERLALELLEEHRKLLRSLFPKYKGSEVKTVGDMFLVEFASALEAVRCAIQIQEVISNRNRKHSESKKIRLRIGIHVGDVEHSQGDVYGDAVNIASRIEPLAEPGGIVVSRQVYDQIRNRSDIKMHSLGSRELKNVKESLEVFRISP